MVRRLSVASSPSIKMIKTNDKDTLGNINKIHENISHYWRELETELV